MTPIKINDRYISVENPPYIIAEMSANHNGSLEMAFRIIEEAKIAGANAIKIQTYRADTITLKSDKPDFRITSGIWMGQTLYELYESAYTPWEWHPALFEHARKHDITIFSSPFDKSAIDFLEDLGAPAYKIASFEAIDIPLIKYAARTGKPLIISTGMANLTEINEAIAAAYDGGCKELALLHCVSGYPAPAKDYNLRTIPDMVRRFGLPIGLSDHTEGNAAAIAGIALGAMIVEKHFTLDRSLGGPDCSFSIVPKELSQLCTDALAAWNALGEINYERKPSEGNNIKFRRSLYFVRSVKRGERITAEDIRSIRPGFGAPPKMYDQLIGKRVTCDVSVGTPVTLDILMDSNE